jgi:hypothetical protein
MDMDKAADKLIREAYWSLIKERMEWISVKDRLPTGRWARCHSYLSEEVLIANSCSINIGYYNREKCIWYVNEPSKAEWVDKITHWMPLPKNPHKGGEDALD